VNLEKLKTFEFPTIHQTYTKRDSIIYALGLGFGTRPLDAEHLKFVYEAAIEAVPSMCVVLGYPGLWIRDPALEFDWLRLLHGEHYFAIHRTLPPEGVITSHHRIVAVADKGPGQGALVFMEKTLRDSDAVVMATVRQTLFLRGDGGCGNFGKPPMEFAALPTHAADNTLLIETHPNSALLYRLNGDWNPIHADPQTARAAGFERPILHGLCSMGLACRAILDAYCRGDSKQLQSLFVRFSKPVFPGDTIRFEFYEGNSALSFRAVAVERNVTVLDRCVAQVQK
jgi:acyl dehydratase